MKTRLLILFILAYVSSYAQPTQGTYTIISQRYNWLAGYFRALHLPAGCGFPTFQAGQWHGAGAVYLDSCLPRIYYYNGSTWTAIADSSEAGGGGGGGITNHTMLSNLAWASSGHTGTANRIAAFDGSGNAIYKQVGVDIQAYNAALAAIVGLSPTNDDVLQYKSGAWANRTIAQLKTDLNYTIPAQFNPIAGTNINLTGTYPNITINSNQDANWVHLSDYTTPNDGLSDTVGIKAAVATGKNVIIDPGEWIWDSYRCTLSTNQRITGYGPRSVIKFTKDTADVFFIPQGTYHVQIDNIKFIGKGRGSTPGGEVFTYSNAIFIQGDSNRVQYCDFHAVKGSGVTGYVVSGTMYSNEVSFCRFDSCGVGIYALTNMEYSLFGTNQAYHCRVGFMEYCAGNNTWDFLTSNYNDYGMRIYGTSGCNGDHGALTNSKLNHNTTAIDLRGINNEYHIGNVKCYQGNFEIGSTDTVRRLFMDNCVFSGNTINVTRASQSQITGGTFGTSAVTVNIGTGVKFCNIQNSPYSTVACVSGAGSLQDVTDVGATTNDDITLDAADLIFDEGNTTTLHALNPAGNITLNLPPGNNNDTLASRAYARSVGGSGGSSYTFSTGLTESGGTVTANLATGVSGGQTGIGGTGTTDGLTFKATSGAGSSTTDMAFRWTYRNNGGTQFMRVNHDGTIGIGTDPFSGFKLTMYSLGTSSATSAMLIRQSGGGNLLQLDDAGSLTVGVASSVSTATFSSMLKINGRSFFGGTTAPTANVHMAAGTATASTAPLKFTTGTSLTSAEAGAMEYTTDDLFFTIATGTARKRLLMADATGGLTSGRVAVATTNGRLTDNDNFKLSGTKVMIGNPSSIPGLLNVNGGVGLKITNVTTNTTLDENYYTVLSDATSGNITISLPAASLWTGGIYIIKKIDGTANTVTIDANSSETIDGATTQVITAQWSSLTIQCNGTAWFIL